MNATDIKEICVKGSESYYNYLASKPNGGVEEIDVHNIESINEDTFKISIARKLFDVDTISFQYSGIENKTYSTDEIRIKVYDNEKRIVIVKASGNALQRMNRRINTEWKIIIDLKFLIKRVIDWYQSNGNRLTLNIENNLENRFNESVIFNEAGYIPSEEQKKAIKMLFENTISYVWGAPGTGKTRFVLSYSILSYIKSGQRILVLAPTNVALEQVLSGVLEMTDKANFERKKILRLGYPSQEFADIFGDICEIQGIEKELEQVNNQIYIISSILGLDNKKETEIKNIISTIESLQDLSISISSKNNTLNDNVNNIVKHKDSLRYQNVKLETVILEKTNLIKKKNSVRGKIVGFLFHRIDFEKEINLIINKQIQFEDLINQDNRAISNYEQKETTLKNEICLLNEDKEKNKFKLKELGAKIDIDKKDYSDILNEYRKKLETEIESKQTYLSLSKDYDNLSNTQLNDLLIQYQNRRNLLEEYSIETRILDCQVVGATIDTYISRFKDKSLIFAHIFIDEAGYANIVKALTVFASKVPITLLGDHRQLPPVCVLNKTDILNSDNYKEIFVWAQSAIFVSDFWKSHSLNDAITIFSNAVSPSLSYMPKTSLTESFRFGPNLAQVLDKFVYNEGFTAKKLENTQIVICNVSNPRTAQNGTRLNKAEAIAIRDFVNSNFDDNSQIAILTPYKEQVKAIQRLLPHYKDDNKILTVHKSQGREWDIVIYSVCDIGNGKKP